METLPGYVLFIISLALMVTSTMLGIARGRRIAAAKRPTGDHLGTIQNALLGLLALLLGFAFSGAMARFVGRQDALAAEASAIESAYETSALATGPSGAGAISSNLRQHIREYAGIRLELFRAGEGDDSAPILKRLLENYNTMLNAATQNARVNPQYADLVLPAVQNVRAQLAARNIIAKRHLPSEFVAVMLICSCVAMGTIGYAVGLEERHSVGMALVLAALISTTLFLIMDFDRPHQGIIRLHPGPFSEMLTRIADGK